jgi:two-component system LytT family response regulator
MNNNVKISIIDDTKRRVNSIEKLLEKSFKNNSNFIHVLSDITKAQQSIDNDKINIFFIHIDETKEYILNFIDINKNNDQVIVIVYSLNSNFALQALKLNVFDYILYPIDVVMFNKCIKRLIIQIEKSEFDTFHNVNLIEKKILIHTHEKTIIAEVDKILRIESDGSYSNFYIENNKSVLTVSKNLKFFCDKIKSNTFFRLNRFNIINISKIVEIQKVIGDGLIIFSDKTSLYVSRIDKDNLVKYMRNQNQLFFD